DTALQRRIRRPRRNECRLLEQLSQICNQLCVGGNDEVLFRYDRTIGVTMNHLTFRGTSARGTRKHDGNPNGSESLQSYQMLCAWWVRGKIYLRPEVLHSTGHSIKLNTSRANKRLRTRYLHPTCT